MTAARWPRYLGVVIGFSCVWLIAYPLWPSPPATVPLGLALAACWIGYCLGAAAEGRRND